MRSDPKRVGHAKEKENKEAKGHLALSEELKQRAERESHIRPYVVSSGESKNTKIFNHLRGAVRVKR